MAEKQAQLKPRKKILALSSGGGHWVQLRRVVPAFDGHRVVYATVNRHFKSEVDNARFYAVTDVTRWNKAKWIIAVLQLLWILLYERPDIVVSTGALPGFLGLFLAKSIGKQTIWLDSIANIEKLSMSGQRIGAHADLWLTQWPHLAKEGGPEYAGQVL
jgi:UDP-N-acetylglucosamine:LPS N-acetylglucosamine transferase